ncbi:hypothetical protein M9458_002795, partial [Cirrhinus mrigala]
MPFHPCSSGCGGFLSPSDGHDHCMLCLGRAHAEAAFVGSSCPYCESMIAGALQVTSDAPHPGPPTAGTEAAVMGAEGDLGIAMEDNPPGTSSRTSHSPARSVPRVDPPQSGLDFSFGAPEGDEISVAASEGGLSLSDAEGSTGLPPSGFMAQSEAEAEMAAVLARAAKSFGLERSRLDDWFLGTLHGNISTLVDATSSPSPALMHRAGVQEDLCHRSPAEAGPRNKTTSPRAYCQGYPGCCPLGATPAESGGVVVASHSVTMAGQDDSARLCDSVRQASAQVHRRLPIEPVPPAEMKKGFYSPYFIVPKKDGGLRPILDLRVLPFKMLTVRHSHVCSLLTCVQQQDWFTTIDLKDAYFHVSILPRHRPFLRFAYEGRAYQYKVLPFGLSLVAEAALAPLREQAIRILNYLDDWLILAQSQELVCEHRDQMLRHLARLGLRLSPVQSISFLGVDAPFIRPRSVNAELLELLQAQDSGPTETISEAPGAFRIRSRGHAARITSHETASAWALRHGTHRVAITPICRRLFSPWSDLVFLWAGVPLGQVSRRVVVTTDASKTGWGAVCNGHAVSGSWLGPRLQWHINCLELLTVLLALRRLRPLIQGKHVLVRIDNAATVAYINRQGGLRSHRMSQLARHLLLWSLQHVKSLCAVHIPGHLNHVTFCGEWRLPPHTVQLIWNRFGEAQIDLFASHESTHCAMWYSLTEAPLGTDALVHSWPRGPRKYAFPPVSLIAQTQSQGGTSSSPHGCPLLAQPDLVHGPHAASISSSLANSPEEGPSFSGAGHNLAAAPRSLEPPHLVPGRDEVEFGDLSPAVIDMITQARAPSTRQLYALKWCVFTRWCASCGEDPQRCGLGAVPSFLQQGLEKRLSASTLKVYMAAVAANHDLVDGRSLGKHNLIIRFLRGARKINPPRPCLIPSWDLSVVLLGLQREPFKPLQSVELGALSMKTALLIALTSLKRVGDLQALLVCDECLEFGPAYSHVVLRPRPGNVPKVPTTPFRDQVVNLAHWIVDAILRAYQAQDVPCPLSVTAHSTRGIAATSALAHSASLADICRAAGWATPNTFARFYSLRMEPVASRVFGDT